LIVLAELHGSRWNQRNFMSRFIRDRRMGLKFHRINIQNSRQIQFSRERYHMTMPQ
jgi:hypothetical protein